MVDTILKYGTIISILLFINCFEAICQIETKIGLPILHDNWVESAIFSPNEKYILTWSEEDNTAKLWDVQTSKLIYNFSKNFQEIDNALFSHNGNYILTSYFDGTVSIWKVKDGKEVSSFFCHYEGLTSASFSLDESELYTSDGREVKVWDFLKGELKRKIVTNSFGVHFLPLINKFITFSTNDDIRLWNMSSGEVIRIIQGARSELFAYLPPHNPTNQILILSNIYSDKSLVVKTDNEDSVNFWLDGLVPNSPLVYDQSSNRVLTVCQDSTAKIWDLDEGKMVRSFDGHEDELSLALFLPSSNKVITSSYDKTVKIWDRKTSKVIETINNLPREFTFDKKGELLLSDWGLIDLESQQYLIEFEDDSEPEIGALISPFGNKIIAFNKLFDFKTGKFVIDFYDNSYDGDSYLSFSGDGRQIIIFAENILRVYDLFTLELINEFELILEDLTAIALNSNCEYLVTVSDKNSLTLWDLKNHTVKNEIELPIDVNSISFYSDKELMIFSQDNNVVLFNPFLGNIQSELYGIDAYDLIYTHPNYILTVNWFLETGDLWDNSGNSLIDFDEGFSSQYAEFSSDGKYILTCFENTVKLWESESGRLINTIGHRFPVSSASFNFDGSRFISTSVDGSMKMWDTNSGNQIKEIRKSKSPFLYSANYLSDDNFIIALTENNSFKFFDAINGNEIIEKFVFNQNPNYWVHLTPDGFFDASPEAMDLMYWTKGLEIIEFSQLKDRFWIPGLWEKVMKNEQLPSSVGLKDIKLQPKVEIIDISDQKIKVELTKRDGGYGKIAVLINGKEVIQDARHEDFDTSLTEQVLEIDISRFENLFNNGNNQVSIRASSESGFVQGRGVGSELEYLGAKVDPVDFYGVIVGVGSYNNPAIDLKYTVPDAKAIGQAIEIGASALFGENHHNIYTITSDNNSLSPNKETIQTVFQEISDQAGPEDVILVYLSGHGISWGKDPGEFYFLTQDATASNSNAYNDEVLRKNHTISTLELTDWLKMIPAQKQVMIIDACASGQAVDNLLAARDVEPEQIKAIDRMKDRTGMYIISGCAADAVSYEASQYGQGLLTYALLQGMKGAALKEDQFVDVSTLLNHARDQVPKLAQGIGGIQKPQLLIPKGGSFDIGILDIEQRQNIPLSSPKKVYVRSSFQDEEEFEDVLGLAKALDNELNRISSRGEKSSLVFFDAREYPQAYKISGRYKNLEEEIELRGKIRCGNEENVFHLKGINIEHLIQQIIAAAK